MSDPNRKHKKKKEPEGKAPESISEVIRYGSVKLKEMRNGIFIAEGSFGKVYSWVENGQTYAVKVFSVDKDIAKLGWNARDEFEREKKCLEELGTHDNIMKLIGYAEDQLGAGLVLELLHRNVLELIQYEEMNLGNVIDIMTDAASGLSHIHKKGYCYLDFKPSNIMLTTDKRAKICDFGSVQKIGRPGKKPHCTPSHTPPELRHNETEFTEACDVFSFGITLFQLLKVSYNAE